MRELFFFLLGVVLGVAVMFISPGDSAEGVTQYTEQKDSLYSVLETRLDSFKLVNDSLNTLASQHDTVEKRIYIRLQNEINQVHNINDADSLVYLIKRSIHARRAEGDSSRSD